MQVSIFGLGYAGVVTAACLAEGGHTVSGTDVQEAKVRAVNDGESPIAEPELGDLIFRANKSGRLRATIDWELSVRESEVSIVCVGTPSLESGRLNLDFVRKVSEQISAAIRAKGKSHAVIFRSTMLPGSTRAMANEFFPDLLCDGRVSIYYCPEFLREGSAVADFREPSLCVIGTHNGAAPAGNEAPLLLGRFAEITGWEEAETIKYACNYFHALKIGYANEIGRLCKHLSLDGMRVMDVVCKDTRLNISPKYMRPGNPFGGSCLPKDVNALKSFSRMECLSLPLLENTLDTNHEHLDQLIKLIVSKDKRRIGLLGIAFKADTDDLRGSPMVAAAEILLGRGYELHIYDPHLDLARLIGANAIEIQRRMPHLASLLRSHACEVVEKSDVIVVSQKCAGTSELALAARPEHCLIDVNGWMELKSLCWQYEGLCW